MERVSRTPDRVARDAVRWLIATLLLIAALDGRGLLAEPPALPNRPDSLKFAVIGDNGTATSRSTTSQRG